jgi:hypothetical protein
MGRTRTSVVTEKLDQKPLDSKKAVYGLSSGLCIMFIFGISAWLIVVHAEAARDIVELASLSTMAIGAVAATLITGQSAMDWKCISALQNIDEHIESDAPAPEEETVINRRPKYFDDGTI